MAAFALTNFLGAFLLFQIELAIAKHLLPWYGGAAAVWTTCMLFFQLVLLAGYGLVHGGARRLPLRQQAVAFGGLALLAVVAMGLQAVRWSSPLLPDLSWRPGAGHLPELHLLGMLALSVALPCFLLSMTSPLTQQWFSVLRPGVVPYRLYALSNAGSLLGLLAYPLLVEPFWSTRTHAWMLFGLVLAYAAAFARCATLAARAATVGGVEKDTAMRPRVSGLRKLVWFGLSALGSSMLLATTNHMCQDVAVVPFLWVLPLTLYLISFIVCFDGERFYSRRFFAAAMALSTAAILLVLIKGLGVPILVQIGVVSALLFSACMVCHGELVRLKPAPAGLTGFYLAIAAGGATGGLFVSTFAPLFFSGFWEFHLSIWALWTLLPLVWLADPVSALRRGATWFPAVVVVSAVGLAAFLARPQVVPYLHSSCGSFALPMYGLMALLVAVVLVCLVYQVSVGRQFHPGHPAWVRGGELAFWGLVSMLLLLQRGEFLEDVRFVTRDFHGVLRVTEDDAGDPNLACLSLQHGRIRHGKQFVDAAKRRQPTLYYTEESGIGLVLRAHPAQTNGLKVAAIGLGVGTVAAYGRPRDAFTFYEINPGVIALNRDNGYFTFLRDAPCRVDTVEGDARLAMERAWATHGSAGYDVLVADAFSGDAIPVHLITREAVVLYLKHLSPEGVLCLHISNRYLDLKPLARAIADTFGLDARCVEVGESDVRIACSTWILLYRKGAAVGEAIAQAGTPLEAATEGFRIWTDDYSNLIGLIK